MLLLRYWDISFFLGYDIARVITRIPRQLVFCIDLSIKTTIIQCRLSFSTVYNCIFSVYNSRITHTTYTCQKSIRSININYQNASTSGIYRYNIGKKCSRNTLSMHLSLVSDNLRQRLTVSVLTTHVSNTSQRCCRVFFCLF